MFAHTIKYTIFAVDIQVSWLNIVFGCALIIISLAEFYFYKMLENSLGNQIVN